MHCFNFFKMIFINLTFFQRKFVMKKKKKQKTVEEFRLKLTFLEYVYHISGETCQFNRNAGCHFKSCSLKHWKSGKRIRNTDKNVSETRKKKVQKLLCLECASWVSEIQTSCLCSKMCRQSHKGLSLLKISINAPN